MSAMIKSGIPVKAARIGNSPVKANAANKIANEDFPNAPMRTKIFSRRFEK